MYKLISIIMSIFSLLLNSNGDYKMNVIINNKKYDVVLENNNTSKEFINMLPVKYKMKELNGNEKYIYLDKKIISSPSYYETINKGDIMLFQDNCIVIFYKTFNTNYSYTKIGHINDLDDLSSEDIEVYFERKWR